MAKLLYITAHPLDELVSNSMAAGKAFIDAYQDNHSGDEVKHIDLFTEDIPHIDKDVLIVEKLQKAKNLLLKKVKSYSFRSHS